MIFAILSLRIVVESLFFRSSLWSNPPGGFCVELRGGDVGSTVWRDCCFFCPCKFPITNCNDKVKVIVPYAFMIFAHMIYTNVCIYIYVYIFTYVVNTVDIH